MLSKTTIAFLGAGNLAEAIISGLIASKTLGASNIIASDKASERLALMAERYEIRIVNNNLEAILNSDLVFLTVKPNDVKTVLTETVEAFDSDKVLISAAAGVTTDTILSVFADLKVKRPPMVVRAMPNTPVSVRQGATAVYAGQGADERALGLARAVFESVGTVVVVNEESLMDVVTGLSGSGPAYVFFFMEAMIAAGVELGLAENDARALALKTTLGAAQYAEASKASLTD
ncbi:MAG: pyrroline-5-carboxylate reductase, partial [Nitrospirota bacterium]|nr:pyrroline-5-carboxylate reductase [Nitrospirota bacterium]